MNNYFTYNAKRKVYQIQENRLRKNINNPNLIKLIILPQNSITTAIENNSFKHEIKWVTNTSKRIRVQFVKKQNNNLKNAVEIHVIVCNNNDKYIHR